MSDKPSFISSQPPLNEAQVAELQRQWQCRLASLPAVDEGVRRIAEALAKLGELDNTAIAFVTDNGYFFGEHRIPFEKYHAYEESARIPMLMRFPAGVGTPGAISGGPVANIDLPPTLLELAGAAPCRKSRCRVMDGRSLVSVANGEQWAGRGLVIELARKTERSDDAVPCTYSGVRVDGQVYVEYSSVPSPTGECVPVLEIEHYDLTTDPFELDNLYPAPPDSPLAQVQAALAERLAALRDCAGIAGRDPAPASGHYCE